MTSRRMCDLPRVECIVIDADTLRYGGSAFVRERTCHVVGEWTPFSHTQETRVESCSECGNEFGVSKRDHWPLEVELLVELPNYCPHCGARVVHTHELDGMHTDEVAEVVER